MQLYDADLYDTWVKITRGEIEQPSRIIAARFSARYIQSDLKHTSFLRIAAEDPGLNEVYRDNQSVIYKIVEP
jgi:hypothetical protein